MRNSWLSRLCTACARPPYYSAGQARNRLTQMCLQIDFFHYTTSEIMCLENTECLFKKGPVVTLASDTCRCPVSFSAYNSPGNPVLFCTWDVWVPWAATDSHHHSSSRDDVLLPPPVHMLVEMCSECNHIVEVWDAEDYTTHHMDVRMLSTQHCQRVCLRYRIRYRTQTMLWSECKQQSGGSWK